MEELVSLIVILISILVIVLLVLYIILGRKRNQKILFDLGKVLGRLNTIANSVTNNEKSAVSRDNSLRAFVANKEQLIENAINHADSNNTGKIGSMEDRIVKEISSASYDIQSVIRISNSELARTFKSDLNDIDTGLKELKQNIKVYKEDILRSQAQSFLGMGTEIRAIQNEDHTFIEDRLQTVYREQSNLGINVQGIIKDLNLHFASLEPIEDILGRLNTLYNNLISLDKGILSQEKSLNSMVDKHMKILEYSHELQKTSEEIFNLMKLMMMDSIVKQTTSNR